MSIYEETNYEEIIYVHKSKKIIIIWLVFEKHSFWDRDWRGDVLFIHAKRLSLCNKLWISHQYIFATQCRWPLMFQTINSVRSKNLSLQYQSISTLGCKDIGIIQFEFMEKA